MIAYTILYSLPTQTFGKQFEVLILEATHEIS